jgi:hypothetical protein
VGHDESAVVEDVVAHQPVDERLDPFTELRWFRLELGERLTEATTMLRSISSTTFDGVMPPPARMSMRPRA